MSATTPMSWVISTIAASMRSRRSRISLRISACTVTSRAVVGSSAIEQPRVAGQRLGDHRPLPLAAGQLVRVGVDAPLRVRDLDQLEQLDRPLAGRRRRHRLVAAQHLGDLEPDGVHRVQRRHRLLEDHRRPPGRGSSAAPAGRRRRAPLAELDRPVHVAFFGSRPSIAIAIVDLPDPDSPTIASTSPRFRSNLRRPPPGTRCRRPRSRCPGRGPTRTGVSARSSSTASAPAFRGGSMRPIAGTMRRRCCDRRSGRRAADVLTVVDRGASSALVLVAADPGRPVRRRCARLPWLAAGRPALLGVVLAPPRRGRRRRRAAGQRAAHDRPAVAGDPATSTPSGR